MNFREKKYSDLAVKAMVVSGIVVLTGILLALIWYSRQVVLLIFGGILLAVFIRGIGMWISGKTRLGLNWSISLVLVVIAVVVVLFSAFFGMRIYNEALQLTKELPGSIEHAWQMLGDSQLGRQILEAAPDIGSLFESLWKNASSFFYSVTGFVTGIVFILFLGIYLAFDPGLYIRGILWLFPETKRGHIEEVLENTGFILKWWLIGRFFSMGVIGILTVVGLWALGMPLALTLGIYTALVSFVPYLGPILGFVPVALLATTESWNMVLYVAILFLVVQTVESYLLTPLVQQRTVLVPPLLTLTAQILFGMVAGVVGIMFALPLTATLPRLGSKGRTGFRVFLFRPFTFLPYTDFVF